MEFLSKELYDQTCNYITDKIRKPEGEKPEFNAVLEHYAKILENYVYTEAKKGKFKMFYQPKYEPNEKTTKSAESLFKMRNPAIERDDAFINPEVAFHLLKQNGHEKDVVLKQLEIICKDMKNNDFVATEPNFKVSVNVAVDCLDRDFINKLKESLKENRLKANVIKIEILENEDFSKLNEKKPIFDELKSMGISFALDDFGSLNAKGEDVLNSLYYDEVKIDKSILDEAKETGNYEELKKQYNMIKKALPNATVVMEGVDGIFNRELKTYTLKTEKVLENLRKIGPMNYQGFGFKKPMPASELGELLREQNGLSFGAMGE